MWVLILCTYLFLKVGIWTHILLNLLLLEIGSGILVVLTLILITWYRPLLALLTLFICIVVLAHSKGIALLFFWNIFWNETWFLILYCRSRLLVRILSNLNTLFHLWLKLTIISKFKCFIQLLKVSILAWATHRWKQIIQIFCLLLLRYILQDSLVLLPKLLLTFKCTFGDFLTTPGRVNPQLFLLPNISAISNLWGAQTRAIVWLQFTQLHCRFHHPLRTILNQLTCTIHALSINRAPPNSLLNLLQPIRPPLTWFGYSFGSRVLKPVELGIYVGPHKLWLGCVSIFSLLSLRLLICDLYSPHRTREQARRG